MKRVDPADRRHLDDPETPRREGGPGFGADRGLDGQQIGLATDMQAGRRQRRGERSLVLQQRE